jgi:ABC-type multidrug transport system permease subunit
VNFMLSTIRKDLSRWRQDLGGMLLWMSIPLLIGGLITSMMDGDGGAKPHGVLLIADEDESFISGMIAGAFGQGEIGELISVEQVTLEDGNNRVNAGEVSGFLVIPPGFGNAFLESDPVTLTLKTNPAQTILPGIISDVTEILLDSGFYLHEFFGPEIETIQNLIDDDTGPDDLLVSTMSVAINNKMESASEQIFPLVIDLEIVEPPPSEVPAVPFALLFLPGIILMALMFSANGIAHDYWVEREQGTLRRLVVTPGQMTGFLLGKALAAGIVITAIGGVTLVIGFAYHGVTFSRLPSALAWIAVSGIALFAWFGVLQMAAGTQRAATVVTSMFLFPLLMAGGSFFPFAALPEWIAAIGRMTPNGFVADRLTSEIIANAAWTIDFQSWLIIFAMAATGLGVCSLRLRSGFARG